MRRRAGSTNGSKQCGISTVSSPDSADISHSHPIRNLPVIGVLRNGASNESGSVGNAASFRERGPPPWFRVLAASKRGPDREARSPFTGEQLCDDRRPEDVGNATFPPNAASDQLLARAATALRLFYQH